MAFFQDLGAALENRDAIHRQVKNISILYFSTTSLVYHSLPLKVCTAVETIGEIAAGGGSRGGGVGVGRGEQSGEEEERGLLTLLHEARTLLQVFPPLCLG